jgi:hypothetical protein
MLKSKCDHRKPKKLQSDLRYQSKIAALMVKIEQSDKGEIVIEKQ